MIFNNPSQSRESILILEWDKHSLSFSIFHESGNRILTSQVLDNYFDLYDYTKQDFLALMKQSEIFAYSYQRVVCLIDSRYMTLVPEEHFNPAQIESILKFNFELPSGRLDYRNEQVLSTPYQALYAFPINLKDAIEENFVNSSFSITNVSLLNYFSRFNRLDHFFSIHFNLEQIKIVYYDGNDLKYYNCFQYMNGEDIVYHVLNVINDLQLDPERVVVHYSGAINIEENKFKLLSEYLKHLKPMIRSNKLNYNPQVAEIPEHYFVSHYANCL